LWRGFAFRNGLGDPLPRYCGRISIHVVNERRNRALNDVSGLEMSTSLTFVDLHGFQKGGHDFLDFSVGVGYGEGRH
jgi:hypothetical protein